MKRTLAYIILIALCITGLLAAFELTNDVEPNNTTLTTNEPEDIKKTVSPSKTVKEVKKPELTSPVEEFNKRITKKEFGTYVAPASSPTQPERFIGYHTGVDVEFEDVEKDVLVKAIANGKVTFSGYIDGYGGVVLITHLIENKQRTVAYGHLDPKSTPSLNKTIKAKEIVGMLGDNRSTETNGERKHLHFAILSDSRIDFKGYVQEKSQLSGWLNPLSLTYN